MSEISWTHYKHCDVTEEEEEEEEEKEEEEGEESWVVKSKTEIIIHKFPTLKFFKSSKLQKEIIL